jgi:quercetin dioxygenase-like cupin family protein
VKHINYLDEKPLEVTEAGAEGINLRWVIGEKDGAPNFFMRTITFAPGARSPNHSHPYEHEIYVIRGKGSVEVDGKTVHLAQGDVVYIPPDANHCFRTKEAMEML